MHNTQVRSALAKFTGSRGKIRSATSAFSGNPSDPWERLLIAGLARDFQQLRRSGGDINPQAVVDRARGAAAPNAAMLAQIAGQARVLLGR